MCRIKKTNLDFFCVCVFLFAFIGNANAEQVKNVSTYKIQVSDILEINVWKEEDLTQEVQVRRDGMISLPLVDEMQAAGLTTIQLKQNISQRLSKFIENPVVTVIVKEQGSSFYIIGEIDQIGEYPLTKNISLVQALALAGGFTEWADKNELLLIRRVEGQDKRYILSYDNIVTGKKTSDNVLLQPDDTIVVY
jgi:polysaccharide export outer membrane protein